MRSDTAYIIVCGDLIVGDSRKFIKGKPKEMPLVDLCKEADRHLGMDISMITYLPVETYAKRDTVYAVYRTEVIPVQEIGYSPDAVAMVKSNGMPLGYVRCIQALWD